MTKSILHPSKIIRSLPNYRGGDRAWEGEMLSLLGSQVVLANSIRMRIYILIRSFINPLILKDFVLLVILRR